MYRVNKNVLNASVKVLQNVIDSNACLDVNFGVCYNPPSYSEQLTVTEDIVDPLSGEVFSVIRHVSDVHFILSDNLSSHLDENTLRKISERLSKDRPHGLEGVDESVSFDSVTSRYIQRPSEIDEYIKTQDGISDTYNDYKNYSEYVNKKKKSNENKSDKSDS